jgi:hypothetical protein
LADNLTAFVLQETQHTFKTGKIGCWQCRGVNIQTPTGDGKGRIPHDPAATQRRRPCEAAKPPVLAAAVPPTSASLEVI